MLHLYTTITRPLEEEPYDCDIEVRVLFSFEQNPYAIEICFEGASIEDKYYEGPKLTSEELTRLEEWLYSEVTYEDAQALAREEIASNYQSE